MEQSGNITDMESSSHSISQPAQYHQISNNIYQVFQSKRPVMYSWGKSLSLQFDVSAYSSASEVATAHQNSIHSGWGNLFGVLQVEQMSSVALIVIINGTLGRKTGGRNSLTELSIGYILTAKNCICRKEVQFHDLVSN